jgi:hypothetical protein
MDVELEKDMKDIEKINLILDKYDILYDEYMRLIEDREEIKIKYGMTKHTYQDCTILSKHINNGVTIDLSFLKRYLK